MGHFCRIPLIVSNEPDSSPHTFMQPQMCEYNGSRRLEVKTLVTTRIKLIPRWLLKSLHVPFKMDIISDSPIITEYASPSKYREAEISRSIKVSSNRLQETGGKGAHQEGAIFLASTVGRHQLRIRICGRCTNYVNAQIAKLLTEVLSKQSSPCCLPFTGCPLLSHTVLLIEFRWPPL